MKSPFPGMDPYLEDRWTEVHASLIVYARNQLNGQLPDELQANIEQHLAVYEDEEHSHGIRPDVHVSDEGIFDSITASGESAAVAEPMVLKIAPRPVRHIEVVDRHRRVITAIEFLSPWNKIGKLARDRYAHKQLDYIDAGVNLVEIDLVRQGEYVLVAPLADVPPKEITPYMICIHRANVPDDVELYRVPISKPLPNIPIPLRPTDRDAVLQLQPLLDDCYRDGRYHRLSYEGAPRGKFGESDTDWIDGRLREAGRRK